MSNETILSEVDDELRRDRLRALWRRLGPWVIAAAVAVVLAVAINEGWSWWQNSNAARSSDQFYAALELAEKGDIAGAETALNEVETSGTGSYPLLARFREASLLARQGKDAEAVAAYDALANAETLPRIRELALVLAANVLVDSGDLAGVQQRVAGLVTPENALRNAAREAIGLTQYKAGDADAALQTFQDISADERVNRDLQNRMQVYIATLISQGATTEAMRSAQAAAPAEVPGNTPAEVPAETPTETPPATPVETPATPAPAETPAQPAPAEFPATPAPTEVPATPAPAETPATSAPAETPATSAPEETPATPAAPAN
jgi:hypothetical protein